MAFRSPLPLFPRLTSVLFLGSLKDLGMTVTLLFHWNDFELGVSLLLNVPNTANYLAIPSFNYVLCKIGIQICTLPTFHLR